MLCTELRRDIDEEGGGTRGEATPGPVLRGSGQGPERPNVDPEEVGCRPGCSPDKGDFFSVGQVEIETKTATDYLLRSKKLLHTSGSYASKAT